MKIFVLFSSLGITCTQTHQPILWRQTICYYCYKLKFWRDILRQINNWKNVSRCYKSDRFHPKFRHITKVTRFQNFVKAHNDFLATVALFCLFYMVTWWHRRKKSTLWNYYSFSNSEPLNSTEIKYLKHDFFTRTLILHQWSACGCGCITGSCLDHRDMLEYDKGRNNKN